MEPPATVRGIGRVTLFWLAVIYGVALAIWGAAVGRSILVFAIIGGILGLLIGWFNSLVIKGQRSIERASETSFAIGATWGVLGLVVGALGIIVWVVRAFL